MLPLSKFYLDKLIETAISEDINYVDVTTDYLIPEEKVSDAYFVAKDDGVLSGIEIALRVFTMLDDNVEYEIKIKDGQKVKKGDIIAVMKGSARASSKGRAHRFEHTSAYERNRYCYKRMCRAC